MFGVIPEIQVTPGVWGYSRGTGDTSCFELFQRYERDQKLGVLPDISITPSLTTPYMPMTLDVSGYSRQINDIRCFGVIPEIQVI